MRGAWLLLALSLTLTACVTWQPGDPAQIPDGPIEPSEGMPAPIGPIVELGRGRTEGIGWRYAAYRAADGPCFILQTASGGSSSCGPLPNDGSAFFGVGVAQSDVWTIDGVVTSGVAAVVIETADGRRVPARLLPLAPLGMDGQIMLTILTGELSLRAAHAFDADEQLIETYDLSWVSR